MRPRGLAWVLFLALLVPAVALGQEAEKDKNRDYLMAYFGRNFGGDMFPAVATTSNEAPRAFGLALGFWGKGVLSGELDFGYDPEFFGSSSEPAPWGQPTGQNNLFTFTGNFVVNPVSIDFSTVRIRPYLLLGGGLARAQIKDFVLFLSEDTRNIGVVDVGGGIQFYPIHQFGVRLDLRYFIGVGGNRSTDTLTNGWGWIENWRWFRLTLGAGFTF